MNDDSNVGVIGTVVFLLLLGAVAFFVGCTDAPTAKRILQDDGFTNVRFTGYDWFACSKDDWYHTGFTGDKNGKHVSGVVCSGILFKGATIRYH